MAVWSGSAGGILIGRAITERPDLFKAAIVEFGALNLSRYETIKGSTNQKREFGSTNDSIGFASILEMDAYHHIKENTKYPTTLLTHGLNDPRLPAWQTLKFAAKIHKDNISSNSNWIWIIKDTGHAVDDVKEKQLERFATILSLFFGRRDIQTINQKGDQSVIIKRNINLTGVRYMIHLIILPKAY